MSEDNMVGSCVSPISSMLLPFLLLALFFTMISFVLELFFHVLKRLRGKQEKLEGFDKLNKMPDNMIEIEV